MDFENWLNGLSDALRESKSEDYLREFWAEGYAAWEVEAILTFP